MKKLFALILALCMVFALSACGGDSSKTTDPTTVPTTAPTAPAAEKPAPGFYELVAFDDAGDYMEMDSEYMEHINPDELAYLFLYEDGTALIFMDFEEYDVVDNGSTFIFEEGFAVDYDFKDGQLVMYVEDSFTYYFEKSDREGPSEGEQKGGEAFTAEAVASFEGDWHGWCEVNYGSGIYEEDEGNTFEIIARFVFDEDGNCQPFLAIPTEDPADNFQDLTVSYDSYGEYMYFYGEMFGTEIDEGNFADLGGVLFGNLTLEEGDDYASISICMRRIGDTWDADMDSPYMPEEVQSYYEGMDLIDIAELYGVDLDLIPEE